MSSKSRHKHSKRPRPKPGRPAGSDPVPFPSGGSVQRSELKLLVVLFVLALAIRSAYFFVNKGGNPLFELPILDGLFHHDWARRIVAGDLWGDEVFFRAPLYPYVLALFYAVSDSSIAFATYLQHVIGSLSVVLVYLLARRFFSPGVSLVAALIAALYWPLIYFEGDLLIVTLIVFLDLAALVIFCMAVERHGVAWFLATGVVLGLSAIARPSILIFVAVVPVALFWVGKPRAWRRQTLLVIAGLMIVITPVLVRNYVVGRDFVPIASQGGVNFYIGNNPQSNGSQAMVPGTAWDLHGTFQGAIDLAEQEAGGPLKPSQVSSHYFRKGIGFIFDSPGDAATLTLKKLYLFWAGVERSNNKYIQFFWEEFGLGKFPLPGFWLVGPLGLLGGVLLWPRRREFALLYLFVTSYMVGVVAFFVNARFRLPVIPILIIFAAYALYYLYRSARSRSSVFVGALAVLIVTVFIVDYDYVKFRGVRAFDIAVSHYSLANAHMQKGDKAAALEAFLKARDTQVRYPTRGYLQISDSVDLQIGSLYWEQGLYSRAIEALERIRGNNAEAARASSLLADSYVRKGRFADAVSTYTALLQRSPNDIQNLLGIAVAYRGTGNLERAQQILEGLSRQRHALTGRAHLELARTLEMKGELEASIPHYEAATHMATEVREAYLGLAQLYRRLGDKVKALETLQVLRSRFPGDREIEDQIRSLGGNP